MVVITRRRKVGTICGHDIYSIGKSEMIAIPCPIVWPNVANSRDENRSFIYSLCKYCVLPVVITLLVLNSIKPASLRPFVLGVFDINLLFIYVTIGHFLFHAFQFIFGATLCVVVGDVYFILYFCFILAHLRYILSSCIHIPS
jgi:hypothetical protein